MGEEEEVQMTPQKARGKSEEETVVRNTLETSVSECHLISLIQEEGEADRKLPEWEELGLSGNNEELLGKREVVHRQNPPRALLLHWTHFTKRKDVIDKGQASIGWGIHLYIKAFTAHCLIWSLSICGELVLPAIAYVTSLPSSPRGGRSTRARPWTWFYVAFPTLESWAKWTFLFHTLALSLGVTERLQTIAKGCVWGWPWLKDQNLEGLMIEIKVFGACVPEHRESGSHLSQILEGLVFFGSWSLPSPKLVLSGLCFRWDTLFTDARLPPPPPTSKSPLWWHGVHPDSLRSPLLFKITWILFATMNSSPHVNNTFTKTRM